MGTVRMLLLSHDRSRNNTFGILIFFSFYSLVISMNMDMEGEKDEDIFNARPQRFSFGLGKRGSPTAAIKDKRLHELLVRINKWGLSGPHGLFKRSTAWSTKTSLRNELFGNIFSRGWMNQSSKEAPI